MNRQQGITAGIVAIIIIGLGAMYINNRDEALTTNEEVTTTAPDTEQVTTSAGTYTNAAFGYSIDFPTTYTLREYAQGNIVVGTISGDMMNGAAEVRIITVQGKEGQTFQNAIIEETKKLCDADGPTGSFRCGDVEQIQPFTTTRGMAGFSFYLRGEMKDADGKTTTSPKGPFIAFLRQTGTNASSVILVHSPLNQASSDSEMISAIAATLELETN